MNYALWIHQSPLAKLIKSNGKRKYFALIFRFFRNNLYLCSLSARRIITKEANSPSPHVSHIAG